MLALAFACSPALQVEPEARSERPNLVVIMADDQGYGDLGLQGATGFTTPHLDALAAEGTRFTSFYSSMPVCTPSRAGLLTGAHPMRLSLGERVLFPYSDEGLHPDEHTLAEILRDVGYATGMVGKWHLGHHAEFMPMEQGFDSFFGVPYSNDMDRHNYASRGFQAPPLPLYDDLEVIEGSPDQALLTRRYTDAAIEFLSEQGEAPFFLYVAHTMPHLPLHASEEFAGSSELGLYGDVLQELDHGVGRVMAALDELELRENTIVLYTSDNGPWRRESSGGLRGRKGTTWEGGMRVPCLLRWPGHVPSGRVDAGPWTMVDLVPTMIDVLGLRTQLAPLDGRSVRALWEGGAMAAVPMPYYKNERLEAVREGRWKLRVAQPGNGGPVVELYDLEADRGESTDVAEAHPEVVAQLQARAEEFRELLGDRVSGRSGSAVRPTATHMPAAEPGDD